LDEAIRLNPKYAVSWNNKGLVLEVLGGTTEAKARELGFTGDSSTGNHVQCTLRPPGLTPARVRTRAGTGGLRMNEDLRHGFPTLCPLRKLFF